MYVNAGAISTIRRPMMPMTINNSINVKPRILLGPRFAEVRCPRSDSGKDGHQELAQGEDKSAVPILPNAELNFVHIFFLSPR
jgi:hypothetical protein